MQRTTPSNGSVKFENPSAAHSVPLLGSGIHESQYAADSQIPFKLDEDIKQLATVRTRWIPLPLRGWFWIPFIVFLVATGIGLEVALKVTNDRQGWIAHGDISDARDVFHYVYTLPPVAVAAVIVALWAWTDIEIKKLQPYVDLFRGDAPAEHSLLLDYTRTNNFFVWTEAAKNRHYLVSLASLMLLMSLTFQPLAAALLTVKNVYSNEPDMIMNTLATVGLNQNAQFGDLTSFLTAAGFAGAAILYNLGSAPFVHNQYTIPSFQIPTTIQNGTIFTNTTALKSDPGCVSVNVDMEQHTDGSGWTNTVSYNGCVISFVVDKNATTLFGTDIPSCDPSILPQFSPALFWFFTYVPSPLASATLCYPTFTLWEATVAMDIASQNITRVTELRPFTTSSPFSDNSANVTGQPLNGRAYNGIMFNLTDPDRFVLARANATQLQLPAAVYQAALQTQQGPAAIFSNTTLEPLVNAVYGIYLSLIAKEVYLLPAQEPITLQIMTVQQRLFLSPVAVHLLCTALLILAFFGLLIHLFHTSDRRDLRLQHEPGTIASAVSIAAGTSVAGVLAGQKSRGHLHEALQGRKFMMDQTTGRLVMDNEEDYRLVQRPGLLQSIGKRMSVMASPIKTEF